MPVLFCPDVRRSGVLLGVRGARARVETAGEAARCPGCGGALERVDVGKTVLLECARCDGTWIDADRFEALRADGEAQAAVLHRYAGRPRATSTP